MAQLLVGKIDVTKIDKSKLFEGKNGAKYLDIVLIPSPKSQYGDSHFIVQGVSKAEREAGVKGAIIGNAKEKGGSAPTANRATAPAASSTDDNSDVPF